MVMRASELLNSGREDSMAGAGVVEGRRKRDVMDVMDGMAL